MWNRTDGVGERLSNFRIIVLNDKHEPIWRNEVALPPNPSREFTVNGQQLIEFETALADFSQAGFDPTDVLINKDPKTKGWAVGGAVGQPHALTLIAKQGVEIPPGATMTVIIEQASNFANHMLILSKEILQKSSLNFDLLKPLIQETFTKGLTIGPENAQTGPAMRGDLEILDRHIEFLQEDPTLSEIYKIISQHILDRYQSD